MSRGLHFVTHVAVTHVAIFMATCMFSLGALGAWQPKTKKDLVDRIGFGPSSDGCNNPIIGPDNEPISEWDVSRVTDMSDLFQFCKNFNGDISGWDTSNATTFNSMFYRATAFNQPLGSWNTEKVTTLYEMFNGATAFNQPLGSWNTEKATTFGYMFDNATAFNQSLGSWNTEKVTNFGGMFNGTSVSIDTTAYWDTTNAGSGEFPAVLSPQQPCPAGYNMSQTYPNGPGAQYGNLTARCPDGCNLAGYYEQPNGVCSECAVAHCNVCTSNPTTECDTCTTGYNVNSNHTACECVFGTEPTVDGLLCTDCTTKLHADRYYVTQANCTTVLCTTRAATEYFNKSAVYTADTCSVATCAFGEEPAGDGLSCTDCPTKLHPDQYYNTQGSCTSERKRTSESDLALPLGLGLGMGALVVIMGAVIVVLVVKKKRGKPMFTRLGDDPDK